MINEGNRIEILVDACPSTLSRKCFAEARR